MEQKFSTLYLKPILTFFILKTVHFEILKSRDIGILSLNIKNNVK